MATIGLDKLFFATITEDAQGEETYATPQRLAKAITAELSIELAEAILYADDGPTEVVKEFKSGSLTLNIDDLAPEVAEVLTGAKRDKNGVLVSATEDGGDPVAVGFRAKRSSGVYTYFWLYRVKFAPPQTSLTTKGDEVSFQTPTIEGTILRRNKADARGNHPWKAEVTESSATEASVKSWYEAVYEPSFTTTSAAS